MTELVLDLDPALGRRAGLEQALRRAIVEGRLRPGGGLPPTRRLAEDLGCSRATVVAAYEQLVSEGYLAARQGAGTRVAEVASRPPPTTGSGPGPAGPPTPFDRFRHDFRPGAPDVSQFPRAAWLRSVRRSVAAADDTVFDYGDPAGNPQLRRVLADYLARARALDTEAGAVWLYGGFFAAIGFVAEALVRRGVTTMAVEDPSLFVVRDLLSGRGLDLVPIPVDDDGIDVEQLARSGAGAVLVTPSHQFPLGVTMSAGRRTALVEWARDGDRWIVEDDYDGEFRYDRQPLGSLQGLAPDRVLYAGTASKVLAPGLRLAWVVVPPGLRRTMAAVTHLRAGVGTVDQLALADFIGHGELDRHLRRVRALYLDRHRQLAAAIAAEVDWLVPRSSVAAGLHLTMTLAGLPDGAGERVRVEERLVATAAAADIGVFSLAPHWLGPATEHGLVIGYSRPPQHGYAHSLERLVAWLASFRFED